MYRALIKSPLSLTELWVPSVYSISQNLKKKRWVTSKFVSPFGCRETVGKIKETLVSIRFFLFWFLFWISNRTVKKDQNFIAFWDRIMFLGLFIFAVESDYVFGFVYICWGFNFSALLIKIYFDQSLIWSIMVSCY